MRYNDDAWAPLREAVPSFREAWTAHAASEYYDDTLTGPNVTQLVRHVSTRIAAGDWSEYPGMVAAMERLYATLSDEASDFLLTVGLLEDLITEAETLGIDIWRLYRPLGPRSRDGWRIAYHYTHNGAEWKPPRADV